MLHRDRRDRGALLALGIIVCGAVLAAWFGHYSDQPNRQPDTSQQETPSTEQPPPASNPWPQFTPADTYAQWIVAFLSIIGTGVSVWAVILVRNTLELNRKAVAAAEHGNKQSARAALAAQHAANASIEANKIARETGIAQVRAYLTVVGGEFWVNGNFVNIRVDVLNTGQSPAVKCTVSARLSTPTMTDEYVGPPLIYTEWSWAEVFYVPSQRQEESIVTFDHKVPANAARQIYDGAMLLSADCKIEWIDVFGGTQQAACFLVETDTKWITTDSPKSRNGKLKPFNRNPDQKRE